MLDGTAVTWRAARTRSPGRLVGKGVESPPTVTVVTGRVRVGPSTTTAVVAVRSSVATTVMSRVDVAVTTDVAVCGL